MVRTTLQGHRLTPIDFDFWDVAVFYTADWNSIKLSAAAAYTWIESAIATCEVSGFGTDCEEGDLFQVGASIMHKPSGLGIYGMYQLEETGGDTDAPIGFSVTIDPAAPFQVFPVLVPGEAVFFSPTFDEVVTRNNPETDAWYIKPFWRKASRVRSAPRCYTASGASITTNS